MVSKSIHDIITSKEDNVNATSLLSLLSSDNFVENNKIAIKNQIDQLLDIQQNIFTNKAPMDSLITEGLDFNQIFEQYNIILNILSPKMLNDLKDLSSALVDASESEEGSDLDAESDADSLEEENQKFTEEEEEEDDDEEGEEEERMEQLSTNLPLDADNSIEDEFHSALEDDLNKKNTEFNSDIENETDSADKDVFFDAEALLKKLDDADEKGIDIFENNDDSDEEIDLFADIPSEEDEEADYYNDFFDAPENKQTKRNDTWKKANGSKLSDDDETDEIMNNVRKDLFSDDDNESEEEEENYEDESGETESGLQKPKFLSSHERQQLEIQKQIEKLEATSVEEKHWGMKGESSAKSRPKDSLVDEEVELEFESNAKSVPVMTTEAIESIEEIIKRRIKNMEFDDLQKRIINNTMRKRREREEVSQIKSKESLAEQYKKDDNDASTAASVDDFEESEELKSKHNEIDILFNDVMYTLNALSSAHFTPKPISKDLEVRVEASTITMEDQQPLMQNAESSLAPQEIYKNKGKDKLNESEVVLKNGLSVSKEEMTKEEKQKLRRSIKRKRSKLMKDKEERGLNKKSKIDESIDVLKSNSKHITVIGNDGKSTDSKGNSKKKNNNQSAENKLTGSYKL